jgi:NitT/TauT family transport system substrate-binding protein
MKNKSIKSVIALALVAILVVACAPTATPVATTVPPVAPTSTVAPTSAPVVEATPTEAALAPLNPVQKVTVAYVPIMKFAALYVAKGLGFFEQQGLDVTLQSVTSGTDAIAFLSQGQVDVAAVSIVAALWNGWAQGIDYRVILPGALEPLSNSPTVLVVRKDLIDDGTVKTMADLKGKIIGVAGGAGSGGEYLVAKALELGNLTIFDVTLQNLANPDQVTGLQNKSIDAALLGSPYADQIITAGYGVAFAKDITPGLMTVAFVGSGNFINERTEVAQRFALAMAEATQEMQGDNYLSDANMAAYLAYIPSTADAIKKGTPVVYDPTMTIPVSGLEDEELVNLHNGRLGYTTPLDMNNVVDTSFVEWALAHLPK